MKNFTRLLQFTLPLICIFTYATEANGQILKRLGKAAERAAERTVERRVEQETSEKTDQVLDSILEPGSKGGSTKPNHLPTSEPSNEPQVSDNDPNTNSGSGPTPISENQTDSKSISVYSKFDFVPGDEPIFIDDFSNDFIGDFPAKWNTNGSGDLVTIEGYDNKWLNILPGLNTVYIPDVANLPEEFTLEFDVIGSGLDNKTSSQSYLGIIVGDNATFDKAQNWGMVEYSFCQFIARGLVVENNVAGKRVIRNEINADIRNAVKEKHHVSLAINKQRFRLWINENKYVDVPRLLPENIQMQSIKFILRGIKTEEEAIFIGNVKIAKGGVDLRRRLLTDGKISTNGILFDSGSANIQPQSMGIIRQIYQVLQQDDTLKLKIVGHTDGDGDDKKNMELSEKRADAVKNALVSIYHVPSDKLTIAGKGASEPIGDNNTSDGKAQNRRVEFIKQ